MKKFIVFISTCLFAAFSMAGEVANPAAPPVVPAGVNAQQQQQQEQQQNSLSSAGANNGGQSNSQFVIFNSPEKSVSEASVHYSGTQTLKNVPSVSGSPLTSSNDTCMGSTSGSVNLAGFGGSYGSTWTDDNCVMLKNSREMWNMGFRAAALARMCMDDLNREAFDLTDLDCPQKKRKAQASTDTIVQSPKLTDPIIRNRLGLPPLK